jgi:hypothetical protein
MASLSHCLSQNISANRIKHGGKIPGHKEKTLVAPFGTYQCMEAVFKQNGPSSCEHQERLILLQEMPHMSQQFL